MVTLPVLEGAVCCSEIKVIHLAKTGFQSRINGRRDGRLAIEGVVLARFAEELAASSEHPSVSTVVGASARNRMVGLVTRVVRDTVMAQVEIQAGPFRVVSLMSREAADELKLEPGTLAVASIKATNVVVELPDRPGGQSD